MYRIHSEVHRINTRLLGICGCTKHKEAFIKVWFFFYIFIKKPGFSMQPQHLIHRRENIWKEYLMRFEGPGECGVKHPSPNVKLILCIGKERV